MFVPEIFATLQDFKAGKLIVDWQIAWEDEAMIAVLFDGLDIVQQALALINTIDQQQRIQLIGKVSLLKTQLDFAVTVSHDELLFTKLTAELETTLKELISLPAWVALAQERFAAFLEYTHNQEEDADSLVFFQPVFLAIGISTVINFTQEELSESLEESEDDDQEQEDTDGYDFRA